MANQIAVIPPGVESELKNDWEPDAAPLHPHLPNGKSSVTLPLLPGRHDYKFVGCPKCVPNEFDTMNRVLEVS